MKDATNQTSTKIIVKANLKEGNTKNLVEHLQGTHDTKEIILFLNKTAINLAKQEKYIDALDMYYSSLDQIVTVSINHKHQGYQRSFPDFYHQNVPHDPKKPYETQVLTTA